jgi:hypothetical protein
MYADLDIETTVTGDLVTRAGNLAVSTASMSMLRAISFCLLTEPNGYKPSRDFGANPTKYLGKPNNSNTRGMIKLHIQHGLRDQGILNGPEYLIQVVSVGSHEVGIIIRIDEILIEADAEVVPKEMILAYKYDFNNGTLEAIA